MEKNESQGVLFICVHNAGRSQMAAGWMQYLSNEHIKVFSAGSQPGNKINPVAVEVMHEVGIDISQNIPRLFVENLMEEVSVVVTMGCGDLCPLIPGKLYLDWELEDPAGKGVEEVRKIRDQIKEKVLSMLEESF